MLASHLPLLLDSLVGELVSCELVKSKGCSFHSPSLQFTNSPIVALLATYCECPKRKAQYIVFTRLTKESPERIFVRRNDTRTMKGENLPASRPSVRIGFASR